MTEMITFEPKHQPAYIKVIGVGGGGSNAVNHMYAQGIQGVEFVICNTDVQALQTSPVPVKIALGDRVLGAGSKPDVGRSAATESSDKIKEALNDETQMVFITAGMGGGTGTGAAPIIAEISKEAGILTVGIVTLPFLWEGRRRRQQAEAGINEMKKHVDSLIVICNDKLREVYGDLSVAQAFAKADNVLTSAAKGIAEIITVPGYVNVDFEDVKTVMQSSGKAIM
jgi:cell division protein FtsZ